MYAAELAAFDGTDLEDLQSFDVVAAVIGDVVTGPWWPGPHVEVARTRRDAHTSSTRCASEVAADVCNPSAPTAAIQIRLAPDQCTIATAAHELAHALAGVVAGHGPRFRRAYLDVVGVITNLSSLDRRHDLHVRQLTRAFAVADLAIGERGWPEPPAGTISAIAL